jgi:hypothetical protein
VGTFLRIYFLIQSVGGGTSFFLLPDSASNPIPELMEMEGSSTTLIHSGESSAIKDEKSKF